MGFTRIFDAKSRSYKPHSSIYIQGSYGVKPFTSIGLEWLVTLLYECYGDEIEQISGRTISGHRLPAMG